MYRPSPIKQYILWKLSGDLNTGKSCDQNHQIIGLSIHQCPFLKLDFICLHVFNTFNIVFSTNLGEGVNLKLKLYENQIVCVVYLDQRMDAVQFVYWSELAFWLYSFVLIRKWGKWGKNVQKTPLSNAGSQLNAAVKITKKHVYNCFHDIIFELHSKISLIAF